MVGSRSRDADRLDRDVLTAGEPQRLAALRRYDLLDTPPEQAFDRITRLTAGFRNSSLAGR